eukprot:gnl/TRDRNA2_/TRDRNA2_165915_c0_seq3.p3 gnl/TRDRNA2_/TRDRNA2_165915_c0~~gnl/TRDRNA2_/TRDRNA2_165915_c0_seq3.p3  ORF type:complete len:144 (+),score=20.52 gnl/TRDRNA2_/TRDRNA2_165915_c0_seq3:69-500(+)
MAETWQDSWGEILYDILCRHYSNDLDGTSTTVGAVRREMEQKLGFLEGALDAHKAKIVAKLQELIPPAMEFAKQRADKKRKRSDLLQQRKSELLNATYNDLELWSSRQFPDATLSCEGSCLEVHRAVLAARSPVFKAMFQQER